ncbi:hypothetical protein EC973_001941 [Apophysomyces ossiformis]|uniref:Uncharacterized protein n=1 Tax=Apophysomyces ossiformis TaxID=679940 RepID=A0A8H7BU48_9FUNG|nr:hypothetical protein EC973_001941 [Apophysomyces ossiformis]
MAKDGEQFLRIGDELYLYDEDGNVLVAENPLETRACARPTTNNRISSEALGVFIFKVEPQQSHTEKRALELFLGDEEDADNLYREGTPDELQELKTLQANAAKECAQNETERRRLLGKPVLYGQVIQLYNSHFRKYLTVTGKTCNTDVSHLQVHLSNESIGYFKIMPRYRIRVDGEPVRLGDTVAIQCVRPEGYLNVSSKPLHSDVYSTDYYEVYSHTRISSWRMMLHCSSVADQDTRKTKYINSGQYVRFYHKEMEAYLESPGQSRDGDHVRLKKHIINPLDPKESDSPLAFWEIENADMNRGSKIRWKKSVRIRHAATRSYLFIDPSNVRIDLYTHKVTFSLGLVKDPPEVHDNDPTLFTLVPISEPTQSSVPFGTYVRIQHVSTKCWIHAAADDEQRSASPIPMPFTLAPDTLGPTRTLPSDTNSTRFSTRYNSTDYQGMIQDPGESPIYHVTASQDFYYHDCFSITRTSENLADTFNMVNELLPRLQWYLKKDRKKIPHHSSKFPISDTEYESVTETLLLGQKFDRHSMLSFSRKLSYDHQALIRDIGIIETVVNMIQIPFDLARRCEVQSHSAMPNHPKSHETYHGEATTVNDIIENREPRLKSILSLCYSLLRVFLVGGSMYEDSDEQAKNQRHILKIAGDAGAELFIQHLTCGVGSADMMVRLVQNNTSIIENISATRPAVVHILVDLVRAKTRSLAQDMLDSRYDFEPASCVDLLSAFCHTENRGPIISHRDYVSEQLFSMNDEEGYLLRTRIVRETGAVQIKLLGDEWRDLDSLLYNTSPAICAFVEALFNLIYSLSHGTNTKSLEATRRCVGQDVCLKCIGYTSLPCRVRARFCDLLRVLYVDVSPFSEVLLSDFTMQYDSLDGSNDYPSGGTGSIESRSPEFFDQLKHWTLVFLDDKRHQFTEVKDEVNFLSSVLKLIYAQLTLGFFTDAEDVKRLFRALVHVLDGRIDARNEEHLKFLTSDDKPREWTERFCLTEENEAVMITKIQILEIFDLIFNLRLHVRMAKLTSKWKRMETNTDNEPHHSLRTALTTIFDETLLRQRENVLMPIVKDILKYQYAPLKRVAVVVMHRIYNDCEDLFKKASRVLILSQPQQVFVYHGIKKRLARLRSFLSVDRLGDMHIPQVDNVLKEFIGLFNGKTIDFNDEMCQLEGLQNQRDIYGKIFKNLNAHSVIVRLLVALKSLPLADSNMSDESASMCGDCDDNARIAVLKTCLDFLVQLVKDDRELQGTFVLENIDLLIDISGYHPTLAEGFYGICGNNLHISVRVREEQIKRVLEQSKGFQGEYLHLLHDFMKAQGKLIKKHQDCVMRLIMDNRKLYVPFETPQELIDTEHMDYCVQLIELLSVCGQGENTFGQSFARTIFSIQDVAAIVENATAPLALKTVMLRFLASIYLDNTEVPSSVPVSDNKYIRIMMEIAFKAILGAKDELTPENINYIYKGVLVFLRSVFEYHISVETTVDEALFSLCPSLVDMTVDLLLAAQNERKLLQNTLACLDSMINVSGFRGTINPEQLRDKLRDAIVKLTDGTEKKVKSLDSVNAKFQGFIRALKAHNGVLQLQKEEFMQICSHFNLADANSEEDVKSLIDYLSMMMTSKSQEKTESYQVSTINILEEIPLRYIREGEADSGGDTSEDNKIHAQNTLNRLGCTLVAQNLLSSPRRQIFEAALKLLISLLDGGNKNVQDKLEEYFYSIREERFFYSFHQRLQGGIASLKDAQSLLLRAAYKMNRQQCILSLDTLENPSIKALKKSSHRRHSSSMDLTRTGPRKRVKGQGQTSAESAMIYQKISNLMANETAEFGTANEDFEGMRDTMRAVQLMVEGHNMSLQTYLAKQPDNIKSFNIVQDVVEYLHAIVPLCNIQNIRLIIQVLDTITELAQGCLINQVTIFNDKIINPVNTILREAYTNCPSTLINELKSKVVICLLSLLEGGIDNSETIFREMAASLDLATVVHNMNVIYNNHIDDLDSPNVFEKLECGFLYCMLVMTLSPALDETQLAMFRGNAAFEYFEKHTGKIEVVMDYGQEKQLSRVLFPIPELPILVNRKTLGNTEKTLDVFNTEDNTSDDDQSPFGWMFAQKKFDMAFIWTCITEHQFLYHLMMIGFSVIGLFYPGFYAAHLLDFVFRDRILQGVIASITLNVNSITRTALLGIIVVYIHSVVAFKYFRAEFDDGKGLLCGSLLECFITVLSHGVRSGGGIGDILEPDVAEEVRGWRIVFEMSFYLVVVVFLLNAIFGIIFDTFGHLRDERSSIQQDMNNSCFICSIPAVEFQRHAKKGFEQHIRNDHNIWQYLFFLVHLKNKDRTEYTGPESYVAACLKDANYSFFPINRALCLRQVDENDEERLEKLEEHTLTLLDRISKLEEHIEKMTETHTRSRSNSLLVSPI